MEIWKKIEGYENYEVSSLGRIRSIGINYVTDYKNRRFGRKPKLLKFHFGPQYYRVCLSKKGKQLKYAVHRLVAKAFIPNPENKPEVNHINGDKLDNRVENLEWVTRSENAVHAFKNGFFKHSAFNSENNIMSKETLDTNTNHIYDSLREANNFLCPEIPYSTLYAMLKGRFKNRTSLVFLNA
jgi:HNH endonuclease/NUMOD4 motif